MKHNIQSVERKGSNLKFWNLSNCPSFESEGTQSLCQMSEGWRHCVGTHALWEVLGRSLERREMLQLRDSDLLKERESRAGLTEWKMKIYFLFLNWTDCSLLQMMLPAYLITYSYAYVLCTYPWRRECLPIPVFLPGEFHGRAWDCKDSDTTEQLTHTHMYIYLCLHKKMNVRVNTSDKRED